MASSLGANAEITLEDVEAAIAALSDARCC